MRNSSGGLQRVTGVLDISSFNCPEGFLSQDNVD